MGYEVHSQASMGSDIEIFIAGVSVIGRGPLPWGSSGSSLER